MLHNPVKFVRLQSAFLIEPKWYPRATMILQAFGMLLMGIESIFRFQPDILIDTEGCAFSYPMFRMAGVKIIPYVHYPFISSDMIQAVDERKQAINNSGIVTRSDLLKKLKLSYYRMISFIYGYCGSCCSVALVNSQWTMDHMIRLWRTVEIHKVYPPCDIQNMGKLDIKQERQPIIFSLSQFRPEKNQQLQIHIMKKILELRPDLRGHVSLVVYGGCRNGNDVKRAAGLMALAEEFGLSDSIKVKVNSDHGEIMKMLGKASIGIHTMSDEHFGISIVEFMASGLLTVANNSGGPKSDIITPGKNGFLCRSIDEYAETIIRLLSLPCDHAFEFRNDSRESAMKRFDASVFDINLVGHLISALSSKPHVQ